MNRVLAIILFLIISLSVISPVIMAAQASVEEKEPWMNKIHPVFLKKIMHLSNDDYVTAVIRLKPLPENIATEIKGHYNLAVNTLKSWAEATQKRVVEFIVNNGGIILNRFWLDNVILVRVKVDLLKKIAVLDDVVKIFENFEVKIIEPIVETRAINVEPGQEVESWGIFKIRAPEVWAKGYLGEGIRICVLDTGVDITHPALEGKMLTLDPTSPYYPGGWMEFDSNGNPVLSEPHDTHGHGTHVSGTALGGDTENILIGVAPGATLMHGLVLPYGGGTFAQVLAGMQWAVEPYYLDPDTGEPVPTGLPAHVVSMSWGATGYYGNELLPAIEAMLLANIIPVAAIGNCGPGCTCNPGNIWGAFGIGATDEYDNVASWSSGEEVDWPDEPEEWPFFDTYPDVYIKPDLSAPGVDITSSIPGGGYASWSGTSMATPHVSGTVALILQAAEWTDFDYPDTPEMVYLILNSTAIDFGDPGQDIRYGWGRIDAYEAVCLAETYAKTTGVEGFVYDNETGEPIPWATVTVNETGKTVKVNGSGYFKIPLDPGIYHLIFEAFGYETLTLEVEVIALNGTIAGFVYDELLGVPIEGAAVTIEELNLTVYTGPNGEFNVSVPPGTYNVTASAPGYVNETQVVDVGENETVIIVFELAPIGNGTIAGWVTDAETGEAIENAVVWVYVDDTVVWNYTDEYGYYELNVPAGVYTVYAWAPGYTQANVSDVPVPPETTVIVNITLEPIPPTVVVLANIDYYTDPHLATIISEAGYPVIEYDSMEELISDWVNGLINPKVIVIDHTEPDAYNYPSNDTLIAFLILADAYGTSLIWLGTSYSGYTGLDVLYMYNEDVESYGYPAPDDYEREWPQPEYVLVYMLEPDHPIFDGVEPDEDNWFYLADIDNSYYADYKAYYFEDDYGLGFTELAYINDTYSYVYDGVGVGLWNSSTGVPWFYLGSWAESYWMQYLEPGSDGVYSNNTMTVLLNAVSLGWSTLSTRRISFGKIEVLTKLLTENRELKIKSIESNVYTYIEVYMDRLPYGWVEGRVVGSDGVVLAGADIVVLGTPIAVKTDENGSFRFWLPEGNYTLLISSIGYYPELINVTVVENETTDLGTIVLLRQPRVAILYDYAGILKQLVEAIGFYGRDYTDLSTLNEDLATGFYDLVIYAGYYGVPFPTQEEFEEFLNITTELLVNVIWMDSWGPYGYGIKVLNYYLGDPESVGYSWGRGSVYITIQKMHPIFRGYEPGETVMILKPWWSDFAWFSGFSGETLATVSAGGYVYGDAVAYKILGTGTKWILMASFPPTQWNTPDAFTEDAWIILVNAIVWGVTKPLDVWLENPYLYVGDEAVLHIGRAEPNATVHVFLDGEYLASVVCDENGNATISFVVPLIPGGEHVIEAITEDMRYYGMAKLYVLPKIDVYPPETTSPGQVYVVVTGLEANASAYIYIDANYITMIRGNASGAFEGILNIPMVVTGEHVLLLVDIETGEAMYGVAISVQSVFDEIITDTSKIDTVLDKLDLIMIDLSNVSDVLLGLDSKADRIILDLQTISGKLDSISDLLNSIVGTLDTVTEDTAYIKTELGIISVKLDELNATMIGVIVTETGKVYALLNTSTGIITAKLDDLEELGLSISDDLNTVIDGINTLDTKIDELSNKIDTLYSNLTELLDNIATSLSSEHSQIINRLDEITSSIETLNTKVDTIITDKLPSLEQKINETGATASTATIIGASGLGLAIIALAAAIFSIVKKK